MIHIEYHSGCSLDIESWVDYSFDYNMETRELENWKCDAMLLDPLPCVIPQRSLRSFFKPENIEALMSFVMPEPECVVLDGYHYSLEITTDDGRSCDISCNDALFDKISAVKFFERYAKKIRKA